MNIYLTMTGTTALLCSTQRGADPTDTDVQKLALLTRIPGPKKTVDNHAEIARLQFSINLPYDEPLKRVVLPCINVWNGIRDAARKERKGKLIEQYVKTIEDTVPLIYEGPKTKEDLLADKRFYDTRLVNHGPPGKPKMVLCTRPIFRIWAAEMGFWLEEDQVNPEDFKRWAIQLGQYLGIGGFRLRYGRFDCEFREVKSELLAA